MIEPLPGGRWAGSRGARDDLDRDGRPDGDPVDRQPLAPAVVGLDEDAEGPAAELRSDDPRRRPDPALELVADHSGPAAHPTLDDRPGGGRPERCQGIVGRDVEAVDVVQPAVPGLADDRQRPRDGARGPALDLRPDERVADDPDAVGVRQADRSAEQAGLTDPLEAGQLAVPVEPMRSGEHGLDPCVTVVRDDHGDPGPDGTQPPDERAVAADERPVTDPDARDVGDRAEGSRPTAADDDAQVACAHGPSVASRAASGSREPLAYHRRVTATLPRSRPGAPDPADRRRSDPSHWSVVRTSMRSHRWTLPRRSAT